jgi:hypothetical protein
MPEISFRGLVFSNRKNPYKISGIISQVHLIKAIAIPFKIKSDVTMLQFYYLVPE